MGTTPTLPPPIYPADQAIRASELFPFRSRKISIRRSRALIPLLLTAIACVALFSALGLVQRAEDMMTYMVILAFYLVSMIFVGLYLYSGTARNILTYLWPPVLVTFQLVFLFPLYAYVFRTLLPGNTDATGFGAALVGNFFGAGLLEELVKAGAALLALVVALVLRSSGRRGIAPVRWLALQGPLDGLLMGAAAGAGFILLETMLQYVPNIIKELRGGPLGYLGGIGLLIPRVLNGVIGHMAWAGVFGYFIGLSVSHRRSAVPLLLGGWCLAAALHGFWNASSQLPGWGNWVSAAVSLVIFTGCLLKAKQLEVVRQGGVPDGHSILALSDADLPGAASAYPYGAPAAYGAVPPVPAFAPAAFEAVPATGLSLGIGPLRYALSPEAAIDFASLFPQAGMPPGATGHVTGAPAGGLDIHNTGALAWTATAPDGRTVSVAPGSAVRAAPGLRIALGSGLVDLAAY